MKCCVAALLAAVVLAGAACGGANALSQKELARQDAVRFLDQFVDSNGRVVRRDQGGDTVSEGQAYAMLLAVATGDRARFDKVWSWTRRNLERPDGLLSWHWQGGHVVDRQPSADADLDAAHALAVAAHRFKQPRLATAAWRIGRALRAGETINTPAGGVLAAGPWATTQRLSNPSYSDPRGITVLSGLGDKASWRRLAHTSMKFVSSVADNRALPPDWATVTRSGRGAPTSPPGQRGVPRYSFDAVRVPIRFAAGCTRSDRKLAASLWPRLRQDPALLPRSLGGKPAAGAQESSVGLAGAGAAAAAAGHRDDAQKLLDQASDMEDAHATYFGSALVALTRYALIAPVCSASA